MTGPKPAPLLKQNSWSPSTVSVRDSAWLQRKKHRSKSLTDEDIDELKGCIELGFGFELDSENDQRLSDILPALGFYVAVKKSYNDTISRISLSSSLCCSENDLGLVDSPVGSPLTKYSPGDDPKTIKTKLRQWAKVVACSLRQT